MDERYFRSSEFETIVFLLVEKLHTTHEREKLKLFAALVNSGNFEFRGDDKEQFVHVLRDMTLDDFTVLKHKNLKGWTPHVKSFKYAPEILCSLHRLDFMGLVQMNVRPSANIVGDVTTYSLTGFGERFLRFVETAAPAARTVAEE